MTVFVIPRFVLAVFRTHGPRIINIKSEISSSTVLLEETD